MNTKQHTLKESFSLKGKGLHTGLEIEIRFNPAPAITVTKSNGLIWKASL